MKILMTGATGFIGSHVAEALLDAGHEVRATARVSSNVDRFVHRGVEVLVGAVSDSSFLRNACEDMEIVINLAGRLGGWSVRPEELHLTNVMAVKKLVCAAEAAGVRQFIHCSTPGVVGMVGVAAEDSHYSPQGCYEHTKQQAEQFVLSKHSEGRIAVTVARPDFVYGPGDLHKLKLFQAIRKRRFFLLSGGRSLLHPTYVTDVAQGFLLMLDCHAAYGQVFNIAGPRPVTVKELVGCVSRNLKVRSKVSSIPAPIAWSAAVACEAAAGLLNRQPPISRSQVAFFSKSHASDITRARSVLGYEPRVDMEQGIPTTIDWYRREGYI